MLVQFQSLVDQKIATIYYIDESLQSSTFIYFCSSGSPIRKSASGYFNMVVVVAFLVSLSTKFENTASGMYLGSRFQVCKSTCNCKLNIELYLSPTTHLQLSKALVSNKNHLQQPVRHTSIMHQSPKHIPLALSPNLISDKIKKAIATSLLKYLKTDVDKLELPKVYRDSTLHEFINNDS